MKKLEHMRTKIKKQGIFSVFLICKTWQFVGQNWVSLPLFSILSAQNISISYTSWFYPSSGSQYFGKKLLIFFYYLM